MGVHVDARAFRLLQELFEVLEVVARDEDARVGPNADIDAGDLGVAVGGGVGLVQQGHGVDRCLARLHDKSHELVDGFLLGGRGERFDQEAIDLLVLEAQDHGMVGIGRDALQAVDDELAQGAYVLMGGGEHTDLLGLGTELVFSALPEGRVVGDAPGGIACLRPEGITDAECLFDVGDDARRVEVRVRERGKESIGEEPAVGKVERSLFERFFAVEGRPLEHMDEQVHEVGCFFRLSTDTPYRASLILGRFLALVTEHIVPPR